MESNLALGFEAVNKGNLFRFTDPKNL